MCSGYHTQLIPLKETTSASCNEPECFRVHLGMTSKHDAGILIHLSIFMCSSHYKNVIYWPCILNRYLKVKVIPLQARCGPEGGRGIALLLHDRGTRRGWVVSSTPRPHFNPGKEPVPILQEAGWAPGTVWTDGKTRPHRDSIPDRPAHSQSLYYTEILLQVFK